MTGLNFSNGCLGKGNNGYFFSNTVVCELWKGKADVSLRKVELKKASTCLFVLIVGIFGLLILSSLFVPVKETLDVRFKCVDITDMSVIEMTFVSQDAACFSEGETLEATYSEGTVKLKVISVEKMDIGLKQGPIQIVTATISTNNAKVEMGIVYDAYICLPASNSFFELIWENVI